MTVPRTMRANCNGCGGQKNHEVRDRIEVRERDVDDSVEWGTDDYFLKCQGCGSVKILHQTWFSEHTDERGNVVTTDTYFPPSVFRRTPDWLMKLAQDAHLTILLSEVYRAIQNQAPSLAAMGLRSIIESVMIDKTGDQGTFKKNLEAFQRGGFISTVQVNVLQGALELGHASVHRGYVPTDEQIMISLETVENLVHILYVLDPDSQELLAKLPKRSA